MLPAKNSNILLFIIGIFSLFIISCSKSTDERFYFDNYLQWCIGEDDGKVPEEIITGYGLKKLAINQEKNLEDVFEDKKGYIWLRADFYVPERLKNQDLGLYIGNIKMAGQVFLNGKTIGTAGSFPPQEFGAGTAVNSYRIPYGFVNQEEKNTLLIKIWTNGRGSISAQPYISTVNDVLLSAAWENFFLSKLNLTFSGIMILIAVFYALMFITRKQAKEHLMFCLLNFFSAFYLLPFYVSEVIWINGDVFSFLWFSKLFSGIIAHITVWFATSFMRVFLHEKDSKLVTILRLIVLIIPCIMILLIKDYSNFNNILMYSFIFVAIQIGFGVYSILKHFLKRDRDVFVLLLGFSPVLVMIVLDFVVHIILKNSTKPFFTIMGWQGSIITFLLILSVRYNRVYKEFEYLNGKLEAEVEQRTLDLMVTNKVLQKEQDMARLDMEMAVHIQKCFYPNATQQFSGWEFAVYFVPQSGVSGDLYDLYENGDLLDGISVFDVSGHGISAGLVTMLSKNIIRREYKKGIAQGKSLSRIMENINDSIIVGKGSIENYLTGVVVKLGESFQTNICHCELVNAGHPHPVMYSAAKHEVMELKPNDRQSVGMIGVSGIEVDFPSLKFDMEESDVLVLFSDGLTEYKNAAGEDFDKKKLMTSLQNCGYKSARRILESIITDLKAFVKDVPQQDDITILVLKRKKEADYIPEL